MLRALSVVAVAAALGAVTACTASTRTVTKTLVRTVTVTAPSSTPASSPSTAPVAVTRSGNDPHGPACDALTQPEVDQAMADHVTIVSGLKNTYTHSEACTWLLTPTDCACVSIGVGFNLYAARNLKLYRQLYRSAVKSGKAKPLPGIADGQFLGGPSGRGAEADWIQDGALISINDRRHYLWAADDNAAVLSVLPDVVARAPGIIARLRNELGRT